MRWTAWRGPDLGHQSWVDIQPSGHQAIMSLVDDEVKVKRSKGTLPPKGIGGLSNVIQFIPRFLGPGFLVLEG